MKTTIGATLLSLAIALPATASASGRAVEVEVTNLTNAIYFTPLLIATHKPGFHLFELGTPASVAVQAMAEGGVLTGLIDEVTAAGGTYVENPASGLLAPGQTATATLEMGRDTRYLSVTAMLLPTNDGFVGVDAVPIPHRSGVYTFYVNGHDAGTEANNELITDGGGVPGVLGIPADPGGDAGIGGTGVTGPDYNGAVHIHRGTVGDLDPSGGPSDLDSGIHHWLNPVARVTVTVGRQHRR